jgi:hypothetical protein
MQLPRRDSHDGTYTIVTGCRFQYITTLDVLTIFCVDLAKSFRKVVAKKINQCFIPSCHCQVFGTGESGEGRKPEAGNNKDETVKHQENCYTTRDAPGISGAKSESLGTKLIKQ